MKTRSTVQPGGSPTVSFAAFDFETADYQRDSACSVGIVVVRSGKIRQRFHALVRPPRRYFIPQFVELHGITWEMVQHERTFAELWPELAPILLGVDFVAAHNAPFDISVLKAAKRRRFPHPAWRYAAQFN